MWVVNGMVASERRKPVIAVCGAGGVGSAAARFLVRSPRRLGSLARLARQAQAAARAAADEAVRSIESRVP